MKAREDSDTPKLTLGGVLNFAGDLTVSVLWRSEPQNMSMLPSTVGDCNAGQLS